MELKHLIGDATEPVKKPALICHCCNDSGGWGKGFVLALSAKSQWPEKAYREWYRASKTNMPNATPFEVGNVQFCKFTDDVTVANMIAQHGIKSATNPKPIDYDGLQKCLTEAYVYAKNNDLTVHMPKIGAGLAGGDWTKIEKIIKDTMTVDTFVYTLES
jgi:O-acetyl-ADP-ribose deacetylase (regulator of RNase III)